MHTRRTTTLLLFLSVALLSPLTLDTTASAQSPKVKATEAIKKAKVPKLQAQLDELAADPKLEGTRIGVHVVDLDSGEELYARDADGRYNPASNVKLLTSAAALDIWGPAHTFSTRLSADKITAERIDGDLYVRGTGEGFLLYEDILDWAATLKRRGITEVAGDVVVSDGPFGEGDYLPPGFGQKNEDASYRAPVGAVSVNFNAVTVRISPGTEGAPARLTLDPPNDHVELVNEVTTTAGKKRRLSVKSISTDDATGTRIEVKGSIGTGAKPWSSRKRIDNPPMFAGAVIKKALEDLGIEVKGSVRKGDPPASAEAVLSHGSEPLVELLMAMNKWSNNFMAEQVLRALGTSEGAGEKAGSWDGGKVVVLDFLARAGLRLKKAKLHNGSGLYAGNFFSPRNFTTLLAHMDKHKWSAEYKTTLAIAGTDGTLAGRFKDTHTRGNLRGKTGTLNEVSALSGYVTTKSGRRLAFSVLFNDPPVRAWKLRPEQDAIAAAIANCEE